MYRKRYAKNASTGASATHASMIPCACNCIGTASVRNATVIVIAPNSAGTSAGRRLRISIPSTR